MDAKLSPDGLVLKWNGHSKTFWTLTFLLVGRNIGTLDFKTETVAETTLRASWIWSTSAPIPGTWGIFYSPGDSKLTPDGLGLHWDGHSTIFWTHTFEPLRRNIAQLHFKTYRVAETALHASWFWPTLAIFPGSWGIFSSPMESKVTVDGLGLQWKGHSKMFWTLPFDLLGWNIAPLDFKTHTVTETAFRASWFRPTSARFPETWGIFSSPGDSKLTPDGLGL